MLGHFVVTCNIVLPLFIVMLVGFCASRFGLITDETARGCNKLVFRIFLPVSLCRSIMRVGSGDVLSGKLVAFTIIGIAAVFLVSMLLVPRLEKDDRKRGVMVQCLFRSNYALFGVPLCEALFPQGDGGVSAMMVAIVVPVFNILAVVAMEVFRGGSVNVKKILLGIVKNPLIWGCAVGLIVKAAGLRLPDFIGGAVDRLAAIASPLALFVLGASLKPGRIRENAGNLAVTVPGRLVVVPLIALSAAYAMGFRGPEFAALIITFSSPMAVSSLAMAQQMDGDSDLTVQQIVLTTALSAVTIFTIIFVSKVLSVF
ncbi:MAG: AEC family transporter [Clostridia bacterium]|nr:AEC family transporter [Clostridia bacterium]